MLPRTSFNSSQLIRLLADLDFGGFAPSKQSLAEGLSTWLSWTDAISLSSALSSVVHTGQAAGGTEKPVEPRASARVGSLFEECSRVRREIAQSIATDTSLTSAPAGLAQPMPASVERRDSTADFSPYLRSYQAHQRSMETRIGRLRARTRASLAASSAELVQLATLDAVLEKALSARERQLLATVPVLLRSHFERSHMAKWEKSAKPSEANSETQLEQPAPWVATFGRQLQSVLLAELEVRLHPVAGMIEALRMAADTKADATTTTNSRAAAVAAKDATSRP